MDSLLFPVHRVPILLVLLHGCLALGVGSGGDGRILVTGSGGAPSCSHQPSPLHHVVDLKVRRHHSMEGCEGGGEVC
uniref:Secreted protein n=1 Tax=Arundo donax TaxID=35708 RepID=A0A0A8YWI2_ARUDO